MGYKKYSDELKLLPKGLISLNMSCIDLKSEELVSSEINKDKEIKNLNKELSEKDKEIQMLREILKKLTTLCPTNKSDERSHRTRLS